MKAYVDSVRIAPKKANLIAKMVRGMSVPIAVEALRRTHKKGARIIETLLRSAIANASHNDRQDPQTMVIKTIIVNQGIAYHRGVPMARGRVRPMRKFLSHISLTLGFPGDDASDKIQKIQKNQPFEALRPSGPHGKSQKNDAKVAGKTSQSAKNTVKASSTTKKQTVTSKKTSSESSDSSESSSVDSSLSSAS